MTESLAKHPKNRLSDVRCPMCASQNWYRDRKETFHCKKCASHWKGETEIDENTSETREDSLRSEGSVKKRSDINALNPYQKGKNVIKNRISRVSEAV